MIGINESLSMQELQKTYDSILEEELRLRSKYTDENNIPTADRIILSYLENREEILLRKMSELTNPSE